MIKYINKLIKINKKIIEEKIYSTNKGKDVKADK